MPATNLLLPVFVQVLLTFIVLIQLGRARSQSLVQSRATRANPDVAKGAFAWSDAASQASNNFKNQFEMPVLFYIAVAFALLLKQSDILLLALAWGFVVMRVVHALIHLGPNIVMWRFPAYILGVACLLAFWITLMLRVWNGTAVV